MPSSLTFRAALGASLFLAPGAPPALASSSADFDRACPAYYAQGNDPDVMTSIATAYCACIADRVEAQGFDQPTMDFLARTYSEDLTAFMHEYPAGEAWMQAFFTADDYCKNQHDFSKDIPGGASPPSQPVEAASWGGVVRDGPGQEHRRLTALAEGDRIVLLENTGVMFNGYPWWRIEYDGNREGYQWGGIICALGQPMDGVFETCR